MIRLEIWGKYALFSRPELKVERVTYDVPTPSAIRGILDAIYYHPGMRWVVDRIHVLSPIRYANIKRNEVSDKISARTVKKQILNNTAEEIGMYAKDKIVQRNAMVLQDVHYVVEAHFEMTDKANDTDNPGKFQDIIKRRIRKGQCFHTPYFGCREFPVFFREWETADIPSISENRDLGFMLYDMDYSDPKNITPIWFHPIMENGVIAVGNCEVFR